MKVMLLQDCFILELMNAVSFPTPPQIFGMIFSMMLCCAIKRSRDYV